MDRYQSFLKSYWGYDDFRGVQREIIESICAGKDTLGLMPTGGGKSITFQVPALCMSGICIVVTPLIALMQDQVMALRRRGIKATAVYSGMSREEIVTALDNCILGDYKLLYASPERLQSELFQTKLHHMRVSFIAVDEAHCISQWGYDFRPSYLDIALIRRIVPHAPVLALTASATPEVVKDIQKQLLFREGSKVVRMSFERPNLTYIVRKSHDKPHDLLHILRSVNGSAIVYTRNRQQTHELAGLLLAEGITATNYHAGLASHEKTLRQEAWLRDEYRVMVATNAFGMGIDKADVRLVVHVECPDSPEAYFQEAGRAGRDGAQSYAVLLFEERDGQKLLRRIAETYPKMDAIRDVYEHVCYYLQMAMGDGQDVTREFNLGQFCYQYRHFPVLVVNALELLSNAGFIEYRRDDEVISRLMFTLQRDQLYRLRRANASEDVLIQALLRKYTGLFSQYVYIEEALLAHETGLTQEAVYHALRDLSGEGVLDYIPSKKTDFIKFVTRRVERDEIVLPDSVYADRKRQYKQRIEAMLMYCLDDQVCHSTFLLNYFGEQGAKECGKCEVCRSNQNTEAAYDRMREHFLAQLRQGPLSPKDLNYDGFPRDAYAEVIKTLVDQEQVVLNATLQFALPAGEA